MPATLTLDEARLQLKSMLGDRTGAQYNQTAELDRLLNDAADSLWRDGYGFNRKQMPVTVVDYTWPSNQLDIDLADATADGGADNDSALVMQVQQFPQVAAESAPANIPFNVGKMRWEERGANPWVNRPLPYGYGSGVSGGVNGFYRFWLRDTKLGFFPVPAADTKFRFFYAVPFEVPATGADDLLPSPFGRWSTVVVLHAAYLGAMRTSSDRTMYFFGLYQQQLGEFRVWMQRMKEAYNEDVRPAGWI